MLLSSIKRGGNQNRKRCCKMWRVCFVWFFIDVGCMILSRWNWEPAPPHAGHAEAASLCAGALAPLHSAVFLEAALRSRRAGIVATVLSFSSIDSFSKSFQAVESHWLNTGRDFVAIRRQLQEARGAFYLNPRDEALSQELRQLLRLAPVCLPRPAVETVCSFIFCREAKEIIRGTLLLLDLTEGMHIRSWSEEVAVVHLLRCFYTFRSWKVDKYGWTWFGLGHGCWGVSLGIRFSAQSQPKWYVQPDLSHIDGWMVSQGSQWTGHSWWVQGIFRKLGKVRNPSGPNWGQEFALGRMSGF